MAASEVPVLLYDGECGLCRALVCRLAANDASRKLHFAPLQGHFGQKTLARLGLRQDQFDTLVFLPSTQSPAFALRSDGALAALTVLGGLSRGLARALRVVPSTWRDAVYRLVARLRYRLFGQAMGQADSPPCPEMLDRFIP